MKNINQTYSVVYNNHEFKDPNRFISMVEPIKEKLLELDSKSDDFEKGKRLISDFSLNKSYKKFEKEALPYLYKAIELQSYNSKKPELNAIQKALILRTGQILFEQKRYLKSLKYFKKLVKSFPEDSEFKNWYNLALKKTTKPIDTIFLTGVVICLVVEYVFKIKNDFTLYGLVICVTGTFLTIGLYQLKKK
ncbi:tetratricopeptide repeat protein [Marixanthomonas ophiurae]|uniref:Tetratricopeptide repeat protein n=1 Tax=Marixanthomonas ophiurae TaxID=387659 RepID=A0A3E1Q894_9FLAO|nr:hypothetical protein [Marixanthomonas ophiurae]RFN58367.1 hypothetical protein DZ858_14195 [Marixanthomonas ophiurae]